MKKKSTVDKYFLFFTFLIVLYGTIMIFSASPVMGIKVGDSFYYIKRQLFYIVIGSLAFIYGLRMDINKLKKWALPMLGVSILFLFMLHIPGLGKTMGGATRWLDFYIFSFQPSELVKFAMVLFFALTLSNIKDKLKDLKKGFLPLLAVLGFVAGFIIIQPDLGTALSIIGTSFIMFFLAGARLAHLAALFGIGSVGILIISILSPYRLKRLTAYLDPWKDPLGSGFQVIQSLLAIGSGGIFGLGLGNSKQKFYYLPQQYADFIFAVLCEELGLIGASVLILFFIGFFIRGIKIAADAPDNFTYMLASGLVAMFFVQAAINLLVVIAVLPTTGIPLPFFSYGGTALIINLFAVGLLANISRLKNT